MPVSKSNISNNTTTKKTNNFFSKSTAHIVVKIHMKHDQTQGFQNSKIGSGRESKMAAITKNKKQQNQLLLQNQLV